MADDTTKLELLITANADKFEKELDKVNRQLDGLKKKKADVEGIGAGFKSGLPDLSKFALAAGAATVATEFLATSVKNMMDKEKGLAEFSAITGVTGEKLQEFGDIATDLSNNFGGPVTAQIESFKGVLSRLGPGFASSTEAVAKMGENINTLAVAGGIDAPEAMDALTTAMLQFGVSLDDPNAAAGVATEMMNAMAAGAQLGAAEIPQVAEALKQAGTAARGAGLGFEETNAAIQILAAGGKVGAEAGVALRNVIGLLVKQSGPGEAALAGLGTSTAELGKVLTSQGLNAALDLLGDRLAGVKDPAERLAIQMQLFGTENAAAADIMIRGATAAEGQTSAMADLTKQMTGTQAAFDQAAIINDTLSAKFDRLTAKVGNYGTALAEGVFDIAEFLDFNGKIVEQHKANAAALEAGEVPEKSYLGWLGDVLNPLAAYGRKTAEAEAENRKLLEAKYKSITWTEKEVQSFDKLVAAGGPMVDTYIKGAAAVRAFNAARAAKPGEAQGQSEEEKRRIEYEALLKTLKAVGDGAKYTTPQLQELKGQALAMADTYARGTAQFKTLTAAAERIQNILSPKKGTKSATKDSIDIIHEFGRASAIEAERFNMDWSGAFAAFDKGKDAQKMILELAQTAWTTGAAAWSAYGGAINKAADEQRKWEEKVEKTKQMFGLLKDAAQGLGQSLGAALTGGDVEEGLKSIANTVITYVEGLVAAAAAAAAAKGVLSFGFSSLSDIPLMAAAIIGLEAARGVINSLAVGTMEVPNDQIAQIHRGEMIVPKPFADSLRRGEMLLGSGERAADSPSRAVKQDRGQYLDVAASVNDDTFRRGFGRTAYRAGARTF